MSKAQFLAENLKDGEIYSGLILGKDGEPDHHLVLLPAKPEKALNWSDAVAWAKSVGGDLPTRSEQALLLANNKEHFEGAWYWSNTQGAHYTDFAWMQGFDYGDQGSNHKSDECRARAVRRLLIIE
ncbi:DUF1566 domain-containing protein [Undibacterium sp. SXout20W]|uniref:DUF1566 domain-containing protein n=1 Tax=Undibacterium sp. SXout20W TaxID=3413051 RepID=UPI003BF1B48D